MESNLPKHTIRMRVEFTTQDRTGDGRTSRARVFVRRFDDGLRRVLLRFDRPLDVRGSAMLVYEKETGPNDVFIYTSAADRVRRITGRAGSGLFGTDFSYRDIESWQLLAQAQQTRRLADRELDGRTVYVLENRSPVGDHDNPYERVVQMIDQESCVVLRTEFVEPGDKLRKILSAEPESILEIGGIRVASALALEDLRDATSTRVRLEEIEIDVEIPERRFRMVELKRGR